VVERECEFKRVLGKLAQGEERARVVDQDVDTLFVVSDFESPRALSRRGA
jgi:hypothetical protein